MKENVEEINRVFYNKVYASKNAFFGLIHTLLSFDQQSKSRLNYREIKSILKTLGTKNKVYFLDYGFGHGSLLLKLPQNIASYGCDISDEAVTTFQGIASMIKRDIKVATVENFDALVNGTKFDLISCSHVLEHVEDDRVLLNEFKNLLTENGKLIINLPVNEVWQDPKHVRAYTKESANILLEECGFKVINASEQDRITGFFLSYEVGQVKTSKIVKPVFRLFRLTLGIFPQTLSNLVERFLPSKYKNQQLIIIAANNG